MLRQILLSLLLFFALPLAADEVWTIGGSAYSVSSPCNYLRWAAHAVFHNRANTSAGVELVNVSNGGAVAGPSSTATVPANTSRTDEMLRIFGFSDSAVWVNRYEVPSSVLVEGRLEYTDENRCGALPGFPPQPGPTSKLTLPVFHHLVPAGEEQVHLGTDLATLNVRVNVTVYNASSVVANAVVILNRPLCSLEPTAPLTQELTIQPDTATQVSFPNADCPGGRFASPGSYVTVAVDQPSLSFVSTLANSAPLSTTLSVSP